MAAADTCPAASGTQDPCMQYILDRASGNSYVPRSCRIAKSDDIDTVGRLENNQVIVKEEQTKQHETNLTGWRERPPHCCCYLPPFVRICPGLLEQNRFCEWVGRIGLDFFETHHERRRKLFLVGFAFNVAALFLMIVASMAFTENHELLSRTSFSRGIATATNVSGVVEMNVGFRALTINDPYGLIDAENDVITFDTLCSGSDLEILKEAICGECRDSSEGFILSVIFNIILISRNLCFGIIRMYPRYDLNCPSFHGSFMGLVSFALGCYTIWAFQQRCFHSIDSQQDVLESSLYANLPESTITQISDIEAVDVQMSWGRGPGLLCMHIATFVRMIDVICNFLVPSPAIARSKLLQRDYEDQYGESFADEVRDESFAEEADVEIITWQRCRTLRSHATMKGANRKMSFWLILLLQGSVGANAFLAAEGTHFASFVRKASSSNCNPSSLSLSSSLRKALDNQGSMVVPYHWPTLEQQSRNDPCNVHPRTATRQSTQLLSTPQESPCSTSSSHDNSKNESHDSSHSEPSIGGHGSRPFLAIVTEPTACDSPDQLEKTIQAIKSATRQGLVDLVSIRIHKPEAVDTAMDQRVHELTRRLMILSNSSQGSNSAHSDNLFQVVVSSDWSQVAIDCQAHGIHVKESHRSQIPELRAQMMRAQGQRPGEDGQTKQRSILIGTSAHSVESAVEAWEKYQPDYFFVGTCYVTKTHPEKSAKDLEGPALPGQVSRALAELSRKSDIPAAVTEENQKKVTTRSPPPVLAIGGIGPSNCVEPVLLGADGGATIRAVLCSENPSAIVQEMKEAMTIL